MTEHHEVTAATCWYRAYGLVIRSALELPELLPMAPHGRLTADVVISTGGPWPRVDNVFLRKKRMMLAEGIAEFDPAGVARYRCVGGRTILVDVHPGADPAMVRLYLLGRVMGALLHQRGMMPVHASAVSIKGRAWIFCGPSGAGKSSLAAALHRRGHRLLCDDTGVIQPAGTGSDVDRFAPGFPRLKLWRDTLVHLGIDPSGLTPDWSRADKFHVHVERDFVAESQPVGGVFFLEPTASGDRASVERLSATDGVRRLNENVYRPRMGRRIAGGDALLRLSAEVGARTPLLVYRRPLDFDAMESSLTDLLDAIDGLL
ncbi:MAG: hypothetical protein ACPGU7_13780 [Gammaproteobacteria bacterium]